MRTERDEYDDDAEPDEQKPDGLNDREMPDESDMDEHDEPDLIPCPHCRKMIIEDAERCHHCGEWTDGTGSGGGISLVALIVIAALLIGGVLTWVFGG